MGPLVPRRGPSQRRRAVVAGLIALVVLAVGAALETSSATAKPTKLRVFLLGLPQTGNPGRFARAVSDPTSTGYRQFLTTREYRQRFAARQADRRRVRTYLAHQDGVKKLEVSFDRSMFLAVLTVDAGRADLLRARASVRRVAGCCRPARLRGRVSQISAGEVYEVGGIDKPCAPLGAERDAANGCSEATSAGTFTPNELSTAYGVDPLHAARTLGQPGSGSRP